jgi:UPF0716 protein FxsA
MPYALIMFVAMPIIEIAVLLRIGSALGWFPTLAIVILTAILGTTMLRQQGLATLNIAKQRMSSGEMPAQQLLEGVILMIGGVLLLTPGFVTDAFGFACLIPFSRRWLAARIAARSVAGFAGMGGINMGSRSGMPPGNPHSGTQGSSANSSHHSPGSPQGRPSTVERKSAGNVIDGDFHRIDD